MQNKTVFATIAVLGTALFAATIAINLTGQSAYGTSATSPKSGVIEFVSPNNFAGAEKKGGGAESFGGNTAAGNGGGLISSGSLSSSTLACIHGNCASSPLAIPPFF